MASKKPAGGQARADKIFHRWLAARKAVLATEETEYFEQRLREWLRLTYPHGFVFANGKMTLTEPGTK